MNKAQVKFFVFSPIKEERAKKLKNLNWKKLESSSKMLDIYESDQQNTNCKIRLLKIKTNFNNDVFFIVYEETIDISNFNYPFSKETRTKISNIYKNFYSCVNNFFNLNKKVDINDIIESKYKLALVTMEKTDKNKDKLPKNLDKISKFLILESENLSSASIKIHEYKTEGRYIAAFSAGAVQITLDKNILEKERIADVAVNLFYRIYYSKLSDEVSKLLRKRKYKDIINLKEKLIQTDADIFYINPINPQKTERLHVWELLFSALEIKKYRDIVLEQINLLSSIYQEKLREERNRIETYRNILLTILALMIGITGANYYINYSPKESSISSSFQILSNEILMLTTVIAPIYAFYFVTTTFFSRLRFIYTKSKLKALVSSIIFLMGFSLVLLTIYQSYWHFISQYFTLKVKILKQLISFKLSL